ncbi:hypothetical protein PGT21_008201 [Puccinia graminis f. sp. tritici]|uniref:Uncharacterized protein n=1 Tax=Puccinia graminis f. sp. tritici TaxID=56615 RepID=A0A5B0MJS2_PUCGR|nr:hypothetical protein PGT21_008201 [Puccinia graminis f. sp. tritici]
MNQQEPQQPQQQHKIEYFDLNHHHFINNNNQQQQQQQQNSTTTISFPSTASTATTQTTATSAATSASSSASSTDQTHLILIELDQRFHAFRTALLQEPRQRVQLLKDELISTIDQATIKTNPPTTTTQLNHHHHQQQQPITYIEHKTNFPLKLERKRSRQRLDSDRTTHNPKAARSDGPINSSAGLLSRRTSQIGITSTPNGLTEFVGIPDLLSPPINTNTTTTIYSDQSSTTNSNQSSQFSTHPPPPQFHSLPLSQATRQLPPPKTPADSPNPTHHHQPLHLHHHHPPSSCYSASATPLISPHDLSLPPQNSENSLQAILSNPKPQTHQPPSDLSLPLTEHHGNLTGSHEAQDGGKSDPLHLQLSGIIPDLSYQQQLTDQKINNLSANSTDLSALNSPELVESGDRELDRLHMLPSDRPGKFTFTLPSQLSPPIITENTRFGRSRPLVRRHSKSFTSPRILGSDLHSCSRIVTEPNNSKLPQTPYTFSSPSLLPVGARIDLSSLPSPISGLPTTSTISLEPTQDEIMQDSMATDQMSIQPETLPPSEQIPNPLTDRPQTARSRAATMESQRPSSGADFTIGDPDTSLTIEDMAIDSVDPPTHPVLDHPLHSPPSPSAMPPPGSDPSLLLPSSSIPGPTHSEDRAQVLIPPTRVPSPPVNRQMGAASAGVSSHLAAQFEPIFTQWLGRLCSDLDMKDSKGEPIHQTLMARKMQRLEESADFRPFKFRIQAFTNSFFEELVRNGFQEKDLPMKKVRQYLWSQSCISRFNEEGKKAKSKGNHVWHIEAKKLMNGQWSFLHFQRKIIGTPSPEAYAGIKWTWAAKVWDPQCSAQNIKASFSSPELPNWLSWRGNLLTGVPTVDLIGRSYHIIVRAITNHNSKPSSLDTSFNLSIKSPDEMVTSRKNRKPTEVLASQSDSTLPQSSSEQISLNTTPSHSPPDLSALNSSALEPAPPTHGMIISEGNRSTSYSQVPALSRTDSSESVPISSPSLEDPPRLGQAAGFDGILTENSLMHDFRAGALKEDESLEFDSAHAADVLNGMMGGTPAATTTTTTTTTTTASTSEAVVEAFGQLSENNSLQAGSLVVPKSQSIDLSSSLSSAHPLALHLDQQIGLRAAPTDQQARNLMGAGEGQLTSGMMMIASNGGMVVTSELEADGSSGGGPTTRGDTLESSGLTEAVGLLDRMMSPAQLMAPTMGGTNEMETTTGGSELVVGLSSGAEMCVPPASSELSTRMILDQPVQILDAVVHHHHQQQQQQQAVALHQARLQTVRENLMSSDAFISDSAGNLIRTAIVSNDPVARQFAADVLAPMTSNNSSSSTSSSTTTNVLTDPSNATSTLPSSTATNTQPLATSSSTASTTATTHVGGSTSSVPPPLASDLRPSSQAHNHPGLQGLHPHPPLQPLLLLPLNPPPLPPSTSSSSSSTVTIMNTDPIPVPTPFSDPSLTHQLASNPSSSHPSIVRLPLQ